MNEMKNGLLSPSGETQRLKVIHNKAGKYEVFFPFTEVPIEMTPTYFEKNINPDHYTIDFNDDFDRNKAG